MLRNVRDAAIGLPVGPSGRQRASRAVSAVGPDNAGRLAQQNGGSPTADWPSCRPTLREDCYLWQTRRWPVATSCRTTSAVSSADIADESITCFS